MEEILLMLITNAVYMRESKFQEQMLKYSQVNGNSKLGHALESSKEIIFGPPDIFYKDVQRNIIFRSALNQKSSQIGTVLDVTLIILQQK